jgi:hypothetical protein
VHYMTIFLFGNEASTMREKSINSIALSCLCKITSSKCHEMPFRDGSKSSDLDKSNNWQVEVAP